MQRELGRDSLAFGSARADLLALWASLRDDPEVALKRQLWDDLLREAYGETVGEDVLFLQHTFLTIVVKAIAAWVLDLSVDDPVGLLSGQALADEGIQVAVEGDFFDWPLKVPQGHDLVRRVARQAARFRLRDIETDVLKALYESLVDPGQRHDLGEYYTPDWLAVKLATQQDICALFWARGVDRYLKPGGTIAFVMPYAVLNGPVYATLRSGRLNQTRVRVVTGWSLEKVWPIFGSQGGTSTTSTCVLIGRRETAGPPPDQVERWVGRLPRRDAAGQRGRAWCRASTSRNAAARYQNEMGR